MIKKIYTLLLLLVAVTAQATAPVIRNIAPHFWWAGMEEPQLQLLLHGDKLAEYQVTLSTTEVELQEVVTLPNPNYLLLYLNLQGAQPQTFNIQLTKGKECFNIPYQLKAREEGSREVEGFDSSDVLYLVMPDRFANGDPTNDAFPHFQESTIDRSHPFARHGGDLKGISDHLDYLSDLGITALWLNPVQENEMPFGSYHGYAITDYYKIDPRFGSNEEFKSLVSAARERGIKVVMDMIFNHCGAHNYLYQDIPSKDWFNYKGEFVSTSYRTATQMDPYVTQGDFKKAIDGWFVAAMPDFNQRNPHVLKYLIQSSIWWIEYAGINGIRQDTHPFADWDAMAAWVKAVEREYPRFNIVGETWFYHSPQIAYWQKDSKLAAPRNSQLRTVMDFPLYLIMQDTFGGEKESSKGFSQLYEYLGQDFIYEDPHHLLIFLDNHDTSRLFKHDSLVALDRYKQALTLLLTMRGIPQIYYGTEILVTADKANGDGSLRQDFPGGWAEDPRSAFTREGRSHQQNEALDFATKLLQWRRHSKAVAYGSLRHKDPSTNHIYGYTRQYHDEEVVVLFNTTQQQQTATPEWLSDLTTSTSLHDLITEEWINLTAPITLPPHGVLLLTNTHNNYTTP